MNYQCSNCQKEYHSFMDPYGNGGRILCLECWKKVSCCSQCGKSMEHIKIEGNEDWYWSTTFRENSGEKLNYVACSPECAKKISQKFAQNRENYQKELEKIGWKKCEGKLLWPDPLGGTQDCGIMVPPNEKLCDRCKQWKGEGVNKESEAYDRAHKKAQKYWNSLNEEQKRQKIKEIEKKMLKEKDRNGSLIRYIEGNLRYDYYWEWTKENPNFSSPTMDRVPIILVKEFMEENNDIQNQDGIGNFQNHNSIHDSYQERERESNT